jgi:hypothetical protein
MAANDKSIYLGRKGSVYGPFTVAELEQMHLNGDIERFTYIWDGESRAWRNIDPLPPTPGVRAPREDAPAWSRVEAVVHNFRDIVSGLLENVTDTGCDLISEDPADAPKLALKSSLVVNVIDPAKEKAMNVKASLSEISRRDGRWIYRLRWVHRPSF